jgi:hypothetical protein
LLIQADGAFGHAAMLALFYNTQNFQDVRAWRSENGARVFAR